ncbi:unnamed protein product [Gemmata massiliana]|uniref:Uncharacterized protein n=1 Tax=Gemmata massiliana TaxID=1210884 RepID=A0A6P2DHU7_9BACT|nr:hypothetical protein [Gemmata massiliana]VTS01545.1 unnamed protein product [Gemmata massiliana]
MSRTIAAVRRRRPFIGEPRRAATVVLRPVPRVLVAQPRPVPGPVARALVGRPFRVVTVPIPRPPVRPLVVAPVRRALVGRGAVGRPAKLATAIVAKRPPAVLVIAPRRSAPVIGRALVSRPARAIVPAVRRPLPVLVARVAFARPFFVRTGPIPGPLRFVAPPEPEPGTPGGTWRRPGWSWARVFRRPASSWGRVWRYRPVSATRIPPATLTKPASEPRWFAVSLAETPEVVAGEALAAPELLPAGGPTGLTISGLIVLDAEFDRIPSGRGVKFFIDGGTAGAVYNFAVRVTVSGGGKPVVPCKLVVTPDFDSP